MMKEKYARFVKEDDLMDMAWYREEQIIDYDRMKEVEIEDACKEEMYIERKRNVQLLIQKKFNEDTTWIDDLSLQQLEQLFLIVIETNDFEEVIRKLNS